jgi:hypothetical protein
MQLVFTIHKKFIKKVPTRPWADRKKSKLFMRPSRNQILFFDLPSGADFVETPSSSDGFLPISAYCEFNRDCYNRFCNTIMLGRKEKRQNIPDEQASETG